MKELNTKEMEAVNGGWVSVVVRVAIVVAGVLFSKDAGGDEK